MKLLHNMESKPGPHTTAEQLPQALLVRRKLKQHVHILAVVANELQTTITCPKVEHLLSITKTVHAGRCRGARRKRAHSTLCVSDATLLPCSRLCSSHLCLVQCAQADVCHISCADALADAVSLVKHQRLVTSRLILQAAQQQIKSKFDQV
jgi:hypothetical protein